VRGTEFERRSIDLDDESAVRGSMGKSEHYFNFQPENTTMIASLDFTEKMMTIN
jgi:hypothetical protein